VAAVMRFSGRTTMRIGALAGVIGVIGMVLGAIVEPARAMAAYLAAWAAVATLAVGAFAFLLIALAMNAGWPLAVRRLAEAVASALIPIAILFVPLVVYARDVWPWVDPSPALRAEIVHRASYLNVPAFAVRSAIYFAIWIAFSEVLRRRSLRRDGEPVGSDRPIGSAAIPAAGLALTFAGFDWLMSLDPTWLSSVFGLYVTTGALGSGLAVVIILAWRAIATHAMPLRGTHFHALGRVLLAFVVLWGYIAYFQAFLIQIADKPDEIEFYIARTHGGWRFVTLLLVALHLAIPLPLLCARRLKHRPGYTAGIAIVVLVAHYVDLWWLVIPPIDDAIPSFTDVAAILCVGGITLLACAWRMRGVALLPVGEPRLAEALDYASPT
jgi:hypothetical protein